MLFTSAPPLPAVSLLQGAKTGDLVDTFTRVMGVFLHYTDEARWLRASWGGGCVRLRTLPRVRHPRAARARGLPSRHQPPLTPPHHRCLPPRLPQKVDAGVKSWNVRILGLNRQSRHRDATVAQEFWRLLDSHLTARGSSLAF